MYFFVVPGDSLVLLVLPDIELLGLLKIKCEVLDQQQVGKNLDFKTKDAYYSPESWTNSISSSNTGTTYNCLNIPDYFRSSVKKEVGKRVGRLLKWKNT